MKDLQAYAKKHGLEILEEYTTLGEKRLYYRAKAKHISTGEIHYLYFDSSRKRRSLAQQKRDLELARNGKHVPYPPSRGWRNTTLDNRTKRKYNQKVHDNIVILTSDVDVVL